MAERFNDNPDFDVVVDRLAMALGPAEERMRDALKGTPAPFPLVLRVGSSRSGSTLFMQWAAATGAFAYPTNIMALFQRAPLIGAHIQALLTDPRLRLNGEFDDLYERSGTSSISGKTRGASAPHEFWRFWLRYFDFPRTPVHPDAWVRTADFPSFVNDIEALIGFLNLPLLLKGHNLIHYLEVFAHHVKNAVFIHMYRDPIDVILSVIKARVARYGDPDFFFGWRPPQYELLVPHDRLRQVAGQVYFNEQAVISATSRLADRSILISYEDFCRDPARSFEGMHDLISRYSSGRFDIAYEGPAQFEAARATEPDERTAAEAALRHWTAEYGPLSYGDGATWE